MTKKNEFYNIEEHGGEEWENLSTVQQVIFNKLAKGLIKILRSMEEEGEISLNSEAQSAESEIRSDRENDNE